MINKNVKPYYDTIRKYGNSSEMSREQLGFLLGLIERHKPKKIVEIGVAEGGTTIAVLNTLSMLDLKAEMYSIDLSVDLYRDRNKKTGHLIEKNKLNVNVGIDHTLFLGKYAPECFAAIGDGIDFLILDTVHSLPGELLDFLACLPFLKQGCIVVLHDLTLNHYSSNSSGFATKVLFDSVVGEKYIVDEEELYSGIGAISVSNDTKKYIDDVFSALTITWSYMPEDRELAVYRECYAQHYSNRQLEFYDKAVQLNKATRKNSSNGRREYFLGLYHFFESLKSKNVYVYGCGEIGRQLYQILEECGIKCGGYIISDGQEKGPLPDQVFYLSEIELDREQDLILIGVNTSIQREICAELIARGIDEYVFPVQEVYGLLKF